MAFRTDDKGGCRWTAQGGDNPSTRWSNNTDTRSKVYGYAKLDTHMGSVLLQTFQPAEVDYSGNHKFRWGTKMFTKCPWNPAEQKCKHFIFQSVRPRRPRWKQWPCEWHEIRVTQRHGPQVTVCCVIVSTKFLWLLSKQTTIKKKTKYKLVYCNSL